MCVLIVTFVFECGLELFGSVLCVECTPQCTLFHPPHLLNLGRVRLYQLLQFLHPLSGLLHKLLRFTENINHYDVINNHLAPPPSNCGG